MGGLDKEPHLTALKYHLYNQYLYLWLGDMYSLARHQTPAQHKQAQHWMKLELATSQPGP